MKTKMNEYCEQLALLGIENENEVREVLDYLESLAQICYDFYKLKLKPYD